jgi:hypothetical protein
MILYYREDNGDFLAIDTATNRHYLGSFGKDYFGGKLQPLRGLSPRSAPRRSPGDSCGPTASE